MNFVNIRVSDGVNMTFVCADDEISMMLADG